MATGDCQLVALGNWGKCEWNTGANALTLLNGPHKTALPCGICVEHLTHQRHLMPPVYWFTSLPSSFSKSHPPLPSPSLSYPKPNDWLTHWLTDWHLVMSTAAVAAKTWPKTLQLFAVARSSPSACHINFYEACTPLHSHVKKRVLVRLISHSN